MEEIALIIGHTHIYWSALIRMLAAGAAVCLFASLVLSSEESPLCALVGIPAAVLSCLVLSKLSCWYFHPVGPWQSALDLTHPGGYALMGCFAGCILTALLLRSTGIAKNLPGLLDKMAVSGCLGIAAGRLGAWFNVSDRGMILEKHWGFPWAMDVISPVSGLPEHRLATFLLQAMGTGALFLILLFFYVRESRKEDRRHGDVFLVFLLLYGGMQVVLDSTRYDALHLRSNGFVGAVQVLCACGVALAVILFAVRLVRAGGWKKWQIPLWAAQTSCFGLAGYMEYYVQRHGGEALKAYGIMALALAVIAVLALATRRLAAAEARKHQAWLQQLAEEKERENGEAGR